MTLEEVAQHQQRKLSSKRTPLQHRVNLKKLNKKHLTRCMVEDFTEVKKMKQNLPADTARGKSRDPVQRLLAQLQQQ